MCKKFNTRKPEATIFFIVWIISGVSSVVDQTETYSLASLVLQTSINFLNLIFLKTWSSKCSECQKVCLKNKMIQIKSAAVCFAPKIFQASVVKWLSHAFQVQQFSPRVSEHVFVSDFSHGLVNCTSAPSGVPTLENCFLCGLWSLWLVHKGTEVWHHDTLKQSEYLSGKAIFMLWREGYHQLFAYHGYLCVFFIQYWGSAENSHLNPTTYGQNREAKYFEMITLL